MAKEQADFEAHWKWPFHPVAGCAGARGQLHTEIRRLWCLCTYKLTSAHFSITSLTTCLYLFLEITRLIMILFQFSQKNLRFSTAANLWVSSPSSQRDKEDRGWEDVFQNKYKLAKSEVFYCWILWEQIKIALQSPAIIFKSFWKSEKLIKTMKCQQIAWNQKSLAIKL